MEHYTQLNMISSSFTFQEIVYIFYLKPIFWTFNFDATLQACINMIINSNFIFKLFCGASEGSMKAFKVLLKHFEAPQRSVKIKF